MKFDDLDKVMREYETAYDFCVPARNYMVARIDGRNFSRLTKETHAFEAPFDIRFRDYMVATTKHLMECGFRVLYAYTESDEISLLFHPEETAFGRKIRKYHSILAGEASACFSLALQDAACFDCRISVLPDIGLVLDYFRWRSEDAHRNALNAYCYWTMRKNGATAQSATRALDGQNVADKNEYLFTQGINFNDVPNWQKRGTGLYWVSAPKEGYNPVTGKAVHSSRRTVQVDFELPMKDAYSDWLKNIITDSK